MLALGLLVLLGAAGCRRASADDSDLSTPTPRSLEAAALTDQEGRARSFRDFGGKIVVLSFFFTSCPTVCPRQVAALAGVQRGLPTALRGRVQFVSLSVDPETDSPEVMRQFALANGAELASWSFARASRAATDSVTRELAAFESPATEPAAPAGHTTAIYLFDPHGRLVQRYGGAPLDAARLIHEVERLEHWLKTKKET